MEDHFIINPLTKRKIQKGGTAHRRLIRRGILQHGTVITKDPAETVTVEEPTLQRARAKTAIIPVSAPATSPQPPKEQKHESKEVEVDDDLFFYDTSYLSYKQDLDETKVKGFATRYEGLCTHELKMLMEMMSDEIVTQSLRDEDESKSINKTEE